MSTKNESDWEEVDPFENDEIRTPDMFDDADSVEEAGTQWHCAEPEK